ncbi:EAL domain-containing protein [Inediibacterium massiliense]|uniref:EAL domain-containing protein n=1 Tax=Inediibacterium massiliense TaxID=1658111 RepID=UPI0006B6344C|nr:EAL domain-containing protein [Inediibacterium massiliense]
MKEWNNSSRQKVINQYKLIYIPLWMALVLVLIVSISSFYVSKNIILSQAKQDSLNLLKQEIRQIDGNQVALNIINDMLEDKIKIAAERVISNEENVDDNYLINLKKELGVDELNWINEKGEIVYTTLKPCKGWIASKGQPLYNFIKSQDRILMEDIRPDSLLGIHMKYGAIKTKNGDLVQVGISAENIQKLTQRFSYQTLVEELAKEENITYITLLDKNLKVVADGDTEDIGVSYAHEYEVKEALKGKTSVIEWYYTKVHAKVLEITVPIFKEKEIVAVLVMGVSMKDVYASIYTVFTISIIVALIMFLVFVWIQNKNIIKPVNRLDKNINEIDLENHIDYRLPLIENDTFFGLTLSINHLLDKTYSYLEELKTNQGKLQSSNEELTAAYEQLSASEEELRAQYDEIQTYTDRLESLQQKYEIAIQGTNSAVWEVDPRDETIYFSQEFRNIVGKNIKGKISEVLDEFLDIKDREIVREEFLLCKNGQREEIYVQVRIKDYKDQLRHMLIRGRGIYDENRNLTFISGIILDITKLKEQEDYIQYLAYNDELTNLPNRITFLQKLQQATKKNESGAVMLLDLDNFKEINDTLGHVYGDEVLKKVAQEFVNIKDDNMFVARFGGDEFLVLIENEEEILAIEHYAKKIIEIFKNKFMIEEHGIYISASLGITRYPFDSNKVNELIMNADMAMYKVKDQGRNNYKFFNQKMTEKLNEHIQIERILRDALEEDGFKLVYQPQIDIYTGEISSFEALLRLKNHAISPATFIQVAEENGMIIQMGRWVTSEVIHQIAIWKKKGIIVKPVAINLSAKQLNDWNYIEFLKEVLKEKEVEAKYLEIEITESIFLEKKEETIIFLKQLKDLGIKIALDDFGTGYSSLSYLTFLPVDKIKLDKSLCDKFLEIDNISVMDNIISLVHSLKLEVVAEGIEYMEQYKRLKKATCDYIQGYLFSKPVEAIEAEKIYEKNFLE